MKRFRFQNHNEFESKMAWHDYFAFNINEFAIVLIRRYDWMDREKPDEESSTFIIILFGWTIYLRNWKWCN